MRLTRKKAIQLSIELWKFLADTGLEKEDWPEFEYDENDDEFIYQGKNIASGCFLCELTLEDDCENCPYYEKFGHCNEDGTYYNLWESSTTKRKRKKYASQFLAQLEAL